MWRDIKTDPPPRDSKAILVRVHGHVDLARWGRHELDGDMWHLRREGFYSDRWSPQPTHWYDFGNGATMPAPPEQERT